MMSTLSIRPLTGDDLQQVRAWMQQATEAPRWGDDDLALAVHASAVAVPRERRGWAAIDSGGEMAGFLIATALRMPDAVAECELEFLFVAPERRHRGIGRALLGQLMAWAAEISAQETWLEVRASNTAARRLYIACGFAEVAVRPGYYAGPTEDAVLMRRGIADGAERAPL